MFLGLHNCGYGAKDRCLDVLGFCANHPNREISAESFVLVAKKERSRKSREQDVCQSAMRYDIREDTVRRSVATPFNIDAAFEVSSSTVVVGSSSILTSPTDAVLVVPEKLDPADIDRSDLTGTSWSLSISSKRRFRGLEGSRSTAVSVLTISSTT